MKPEEREFTLQWLLEGTPDDVFRAWTDPAQLGWFYNDAQPIPDDAIEVDLRVGGAWRQRMVIDATTSYFTGGVCREIVPGRRLVFAWGAEGGWPPLDSARLDDSPLVTVSFASERGRTRLSLHVVLPAHLPDDGVPGWWTMVRGGWSDTVERLVCVRAASSMNAASPA